MLFRMNISLPWKLQGIFSLLLISVLIIQGCQRDLEVGTGEPMGIIETSHAALKIITEDEGIYRVTSDDLKKLGLGGWMDNYSEMRLYQRGIEQPYWIEGRGKDAGIIFYGNKNQSVYTEENIYWLTYGSHIAEKLSWKISPEIEDEKPVENAEQIKNRLAVENGYYAVKHLEENKLYAPLVEKGEHWFWDKIFAKQKKSYPVILEGLQKGGGTLRIAIWSATKADYNPDHHQIITVNGKTIIDKMWDGDGRRYLAGEIPNDVLIEGENQIIVSSIGIEGVKAEIDYIDWIEIEYPRKCLAISDKITIHANQAQMNISGLSDEISVFDISDKRKIERIVENGKNKDGLFNFDSEIGKQYLIVGSKGYLTPKRLELAQIEPDLRNISSGAEWVTIAPNDLTVNIEPLLEWRKKAGLTVRSIPVEIIYDQFGYGSPEPEAIRQFISYAISNWQVKPKYLVLVGDASYDPKGYLGNPETNRVPTFLIQTFGSGETASDVKFIELNNDTEGENLADLTIGRIPAQNDEQVKTLVDKIIQYESTDLKKNPSILAVADGQDASFKGDAQSFIDIFKNRYNTVLLAPEAGVTDFSQKIISNIKQNDFIVAYFGHGSISMWGKDELFSIDDVKELSNLKQFPIFMNFTCLTGLFSHPTQDSLAEALLWQKKGGAVAVIAPTSLTLASDQSSLAQPLAAAIVQNPKATIGSLLHQVRVEMMNQGAGVKDVLETFLLFGDPATRLMVP